MLMKSATRCAIALLVIPGATLGQVVIEGEDIVVTGERVGAPTIQQQARAYVRAIAAASVDDQLARWTEPVCPKAIGLGDDHAAIVVATIRHAAADAGAPVAKAGCRPNIVVAFTADAPRLMATLARHRPSPFAEVPRVERERLMEGDDPVRWWTTTLTEGSDGHPVITASAALLNQPDIPMARTGRVLSSYHSTLIGTKLSVGLHSVAVVVDVDAASGPTLNALSAYIALVALTPVRLGGGSGGAPSVLALYPFGVGDPASGLSDWDRAYLAAVYSGPTDRTADVRRARIAGQMAARLRR